MSVVSPLSPVQYAALPWRRTERGLEVLLITTRNTRRWIVPKGWPVPDCTPRECAAQEALEEAGLVGEVAPETLGWFRYDKQLKSGELVACKVHVFPMEVAGRRASWDEKTARETCWCSIEEALTRINLSGLRRLIVKFAKLSSAARSAA